MFGHGFKKSDILNEALNQARVEETGLRIPKLLEVRKVDGKWAIVTEFVEGETLQSLMEQNPDQLESYMEQFVLLQKEIQSKRSPLLTKLKDKMNRKISQSGLDATTRYDLHTRLNAMHDHIKVCHGDFNPSNVIVDKDGRLYVIDWSHATQATAARRSQNLPAVQAGRQGRLGGAVSENVLRHERRGKAVCFSVAAHCCSISAGKAESPGKGIPDALGQRV